MGNYDARDTSRYLFGTEDAARALTAVGLPSLNAMSKD
jgi:hypothetical protein